MQKVNEFSCIVRTEICQIAGLTEMNLYSCEFAFKINIFDAGGLYDSQHFGHQVRAGSGP